VNGTLPIGVPLAGYNHGARRVPYWPIPDFGPYTTWMTGALGHLDPTWVKVLVLDNSKVQVCIVTLDGIGSDANINQMAWYIAAASGFTVPFENCVFSSSHSHSGPGAVSSDFLWSVAPAVDLLVPSIQRQLATSMAEAMLSAQKNLQPAQMGIGTGYLVNVTRNRRCGISPVCKCDTIDPNLGIIRVDQPDGTPIATVWNYALHGVCYGPDNMYFSSDIMGGASDNIEKLVGGIALFVNADAGDIDPSGLSCSGDKPVNFHGAITIANAVQQERESITTTSSVNIAAVSQVVEFGPTNLNATFGRFDNCTNGGPLDICTICAILRCDADVHMPEAWITNTPRFTAIAFGLNGENDVLVTLPGEPLLELGWQVRNDTQKLGFDHTILAGYSNAHMGYFATPNEYDVGGYESQLTFWGIGTTDKVRAGAYEVASSVAP